MLDLDLFIRKGPVACIVVTCIVQFIYRLIKGKKISLSDLLLVGTSASALPIAFLLIWGAFDSSVIQKLSNAEVADIYIAFAGIALIVVFYLTVKEKW